MKPSAAVHRVIAGKVGRDAAQRALSTATNDDDPYLAYIARKIERATNRGWTIEASRCFFCGGNASRTGYLPTHKHPLAYCATHTSSHAALRGKTVEKHKPHSARPESELRTHKRVGRSPFASSRCGIERDGNDVLLTDDPAQVTCLRCKRYKD